ncbi:MAG: Helicase associated domain protein, partial [Ruminococcus sp.]|nr:Helicase associated domain protein [Ruminococcus sp.]
MAMQLFEHNRIAYEAAVRMLSERGKAAVIHPTGTGKSFIGFKLCEDNPDKTICWLSPSRYIYQTQLENLAETSDGYQPENVKFYTYAKLMNVSEAEIMELKPDYIILDEFHRCGAELWGAGVDAVLKAYHDVPVLGLSATAIRYLDNQRDMTDELFDGNVASEMTLGEAIVRGILAPPKYILSIFSYQKDFEKYETRVKSAKSKATRDAAEKILEALRRALDKAENLDVLFDKHIEDRTGKYLVFCANLEHMQEMISKSKEWFAKVDRKPHIYSVYSDDQTASKSFADFKADNDPKHLKLLYCIDALNEGVHVPDISGVILLRPTVSPIIYKQQIGRALSASKSKNPVIFDIVNNIENLYSIDAIEEEMQVAIQYYHSHGGEGFVVNETFELVDKVADCKSLFDELEGTLSASWDIMFEQAKKYYDENGNLDVPKRYYTPEGYSLGIWLLTQRRVYKGEVNGNLTQVQIDRLNSIGMRWESASDLAWEKYYSSAEIYFKKHGDLIPPAKFVDENNVELGRWLSQLRIYYNNGIKTRYLNPERISALEKIGMVWSVPDYIWEENYAAAVRYHREYGDLNVPHGYVDSEGIKLYQWLSQLKNIRKGIVKRAKPLSDDQIARLDAISMVWETKYEKQWNDAFQALREYHAKNGTLDVPVSYKTGSGIQLGKWIRRQRDFYANGKLSDEHIKRLRDIGFTLEKTDPWEEKYRLAKAYYEEYGDLNVPHDYIVNGVWLHKWLNEQKLLGEGRRKNKTLTDNRKSRLEAIGMQFGVSNDERYWQLNYEELKLFYEEHGHIDVPYGYLTSDGKNLKVWVNRQRTARNNGKLSDEQIQLLDELGMEWRDRVEVSYDIGFEHLEKYISDNNTTDIPANAVCEDGYRLGAWVATCRSKFKYGKLRKKYADRFAALGIEIDYDKADVWNERADEVEKYFREHNATSVPKGYIGESGFDLHSWLEDQKKFYRKGTLSPERKARLDKMGYPFRSDGKRRDASRFEKWLKSYTTIR